MKAVRFHEFGDIDALRIDDAPVPPIGPNDVLIRLKAAALNHLDLWVRSGSRGRDIPLPHIPGSDGAGIIAETGTEVRHLKQGDPVLISPGLACGHCDKCLSGRDNLCHEYRVVGMKENGTYAEFIALPSVNVAPIPLGLDFPQAAAIPLVFLTAWHMLVGRARIVRGQTVLVHGAGSGVGSAGIQIAKLLGARVITTAGSDEKLAKARALGADEVINYRTQDFVEEVKRLTGRRGVDVVFEHIGGEVLEKSIPVVTRGGCLVTCGATTEYSAKLDIRYVYSRHQTIYGSWMGAKDELLSVLKFFEGPARTLQPVVDSIYPLEAAAGAQRKMEERRNFGKIVLQM
jgi:NADPH:quinone reductase-like Zn-dependent oxidoreductase